jgi:hypothetical protein
MMRAVLDAYPVARVTAITAHPDVFGVVQRVCGGEYLSLNQIEDDIVRGEFLDPRVHFALNCASLGCPRLPREAFRAPALDRQLDRETRRFLADPDHLRVDSARRTVQLSMVFQWYAPDFLRWLRETRGLARPTVLDYVKLYAPPALAGQIGAGYKLEYLPYDWRLNDQAGSAPAPAARPAG